jgi:signal transduction histidine kinase
MLTQLLYVMSNWKQYRRNDYLRYALYISLFIIYIICIFPNETLINHSLRADLGPFVDIIKRPVAFLIYLIYFRFMDLFLELKEKYPSLHRQVIFSNWLIIFFFAVQVTLVATGHAYSPYGNIIYFSLSFALFAISVLFMIKAYRHKNIITITLLRGSVCLASGAFITNLDNIYKHTLSTADYIPLFSGILLELFFFNVALAYKIVQEDNELTQTQQLVIGQLKENEQLMTEQQETRNKFARDLHDEVGATLSGVVLFSELALRDMSRQQFGDIERYMRRIRSECAYMSDKINDILWTTNAELVTLEKLFDHLYGYARPLCASKKISFRLHIDESMKNDVLKAEVTNHLYLFCKEAINNAVKYSVASGVSFSAQRTGDEYTITISDNGEGFDAGASYEGNGLKNMKGRAAEMKGWCGIESSAGTGTKIILQFKS